MIANFASAGISRQSPGEMFSKGLKRLKSKIWLQIFIFMFFRHSAPKKASKLTLDDGKISPERPQQQCIRTDNIKYTIL
jgi:hypothetical protein